MKLLDLCCCAGGSAMGYHLAGFEVVGIDKYPQPEYPFEFIVGDVFEVAEKIANEFDAIHISPPCQHFTKYKNCRPDIPSRYENLIEPARNLLKKLGKPYIIENVEGSPLFDPIMLCGSMFGLDVRRHRLFETNFPVLAPKCDHSIWAPNRFPGGRSRERGGPRVLCRKTVEIGRWNIPLSTQQAAMGINWITDLRKLSESIPPAYTKFIGEQLVRYIQSKT